MNQSSAFMDIVQLHERLWGMDQYSQRPSLADLLNKPVIAMWVANEPRTTGTALNRASGDTNNSSERFMLTTHQEFEELDQLVTSVAIIGKPSFASNWKLSRLFVNQKPVKIFVQVQIIEE